MARSSLGFWLLLIGGVLIPVPAEAEQPPAVDELVPLLRGGPAAVKTPDSVVAGDLVIAADSAQDATNAAMQRQTKLLQSMSDDEFAAHWTLFGSGAGVVATGGATYVPVENPDATEAMQREAYVLAFHQAKKSLARLFSHTVHEGKNEIIKTLDQRITSQRTLINASTQSDYEARQKIAALLKAFVVYAVADREYAGHPGHRQVLVTVAVSPKTMGKVRHDAANRLQADALETGLQEILIEIQNGLVPPVGGQVITIPSTGETAFVGFSSMVPPAFSSPDAAATVATEAIAVAEEEAIDSLSGLLTGDELMWEAGIRRSSNNQIANFQELAADDPLKSLDPKGTQALDQEQQTFMSQFSRTESYRSVRRGGIPPGTQLRTWRNGRRLNAVAVYVPNWTDAAVRFADEMRRSELIRPYDKKAGERSTVSGFPSPTTIDVINQQLKPGEGFEAGPTGVIRTKEQL